MPNPNEPELFHVEIPNLVRLSPSRLPGIAKRLIDECNDGVSPAQKRELLLAAVDDLAELAAHVKSLVNQGRAKPYTAAQTFHELLTAIDAVPADDATTADDMDDALARILQEAVS